MLSAKHLWRTSRRCAAKSAGPRLVALTALLMGCFKQSKRRVALFLEQVLNQPCSAGWVVKLQNQRRPPLTPAYDELAQQLAAEPVLGIDESPTKEARLKWPSASNRRSLRRGVVLWVSVSHGQGSASIRRSVHWDKNPHLRSFFDEPKKRRRWNTGDGRWLLSFDAVGRCGRLLRRSACRWTRCAAG